MEGPASFDELEPRLARDYRTSLDRFGAAVALTKTATEIKMDVVVAGQARPVLSKWVPYARRLGWASGAVEPFREPAAVEKELRSEIDAWISAQAPTT